MFYINDPNVKPVLYKDLVDAVIKTGVQPQRAYIYLASLGIKSGLTRQVLNDGVSYGRPQKLAVDDNGDFVLNIVRCSDCGSIKLS